MGRGMWIGLSSIRVRRRRRIRGRSLFAERALGGEEGGEKLGAMVGHYAGGDLDSVIEADVGAELVEGLDGAGFGVGGAVDQAGDAGVDNGAGAHGAGFEGDGEGGVLETPVAQLAGGLADGEDFGVGGGVFVEDSAVVGGGDDSVGGGVVDDGADGDFIMGEGGGGVLDREGHKLVGGHGG